jgi:hypothetical protein
VSDVRVEFNWRGPRVVERSHEGGIQGLKLASEHLLEAANRTVPIEEGTLERSGATALDEATLKAAVSYDTVYAIYQHEHLDFRHAPGRRAKWLELAFYEEADTMQRLVSTAIRRALE